MLPQAVQVSPADDSLNVVCDAHEVAEGISFAMRLILRKSECV
jgi:hypothetical protein